MNWIATEFEKLRARVDAHVPDATARIDALEARVAGAEKLVVALEAKLAETKAPTP